MTNHDHRPRTPSTTSGSEPTPGTTRRRFLRAGAGAASATALAGCLSALGFRSRSPYSPPMVQNRPDAVYVPSHVEGMAMVGMAREGPYAIALSYSYPHRFWVVTGTDRKKVEIASADSVHLMTSVWDRETGVVPPAGNPSMAILRDDETVVEKPPWPMLAQNMGYHFGDNVALPGDGTYEVRIGLPPLSIRRTGALRGRFEEAASATFEFEFSRSAVEELPFRLLDERKGERAALSPMEMDMVPSSALPPAEDLPGRPVGEATSGDGVFAVRALESPPDGIDAAGTYLAVSARTPYNRYPLPFMGLSATLERGGDPAFEGGLVPTLDPALGYHYGAVVGSLSAGDRLTLSVGAPPQVARHEGYETAFFEMDPMALAVE